MENRLYCISGQFVVALAKLDHLKPFLYYVKNWYSAANATSSHRSRASLYDSWYLDRTSSCYWSALKRLIKKMHCFTQDQIATAWEQMRAILMNEVMERFVRQNLLRVQIMGAIYNFAYLAHLRLCNYALVPQLMRRCWWHLLRQERTPQSRSLI